MNRLDLNSLTFEQTLDHEWLAVNKIGGYACSTIPGLNARKYHGLLVAAMSPPVRRMVILSRVEETVLCSGREYALSTNEYPGTIHPKGYQLLRAFNADPFPRWGFQAEHWTLEKSVRLLEGENTVLLTYTLLGGDKSVTLELRPLLAMRGIHELMFQWNGKLVPAVTRGGQVHIPPTARTPEVFLAHDGQFEPNSCWYLNTIYRREMERGYSGLEDLWMPGVVRWTLAPGQSVNFICSTDPIDVGRILSVSDRQFAQAMLPAWPTDASNREMEALIRAADQFVITVPAKENQPASNHVMTQYPWSAPDGRDTLIALTGLFLVPGKFAAARNVLQSYVNNLHNGLMPSHWPEDGTRPTYSAADISLWFINAAWQYLQYTGDEMAFRLDFWTAILQIIDSYEHGTALGISADQTGLISTRETGSATTWMNAKIGNWLVTPRQGKPVELNALWYNALCVGARIAERLHYPEYASRLLAKATGVRQAFNARFWNEQGQYLYDVVDEPNADPSVRPNQLLALSLPFPVLQLDRHAMVLQKIADELLVPLGIRTLSPKDPAYQGTYRGNVVRRDRAYHQGTAFPWLLGSFVTAYVRLHGRSEDVRNEVRELIQPSLDRMMSHGLGQMCELVDGDPPHTPGGAFASSSAVAELLRAFAEDVLNLSPPASSLPMATTPPRVTSS